jgi:hypothetical protein
MFLKRQLKQGFTAQERSLRRCLEARIETVDRRTMMTGLAGAGLGLAWTDRAWAMTGDAAHGAHAGGNAMGTPAATLSGELIELTVDSAPVMVGGRRGHAITVNGTTPGPLIRLREGQQVCLRVHNRLDEDTSIHWHGLLVPFQFDGVPGISYPGSRRARRSTTCSPCARPEPIGIMAIATCRKRWACSGRS